MGVFEHTADAIVTLTVAQLSGGFIAQTATLTANRVMTLPTAALLDAEWPEMDLGDSFVFNVTNAITASFDIVVAGGAGITLKGLGNVDRKGSRMFTLVKTAAGAYDLY